MELENKENWFSKEFNDIYKGTHTLIILIVTAVALFLTPLFLIGNPLPKSSSLQFYIMFSVLSIIMGGGASTVFLISRFMVRFARCPLDFSISQYPFSKFKYIVKLQLKFAWVTAGGYFFASLMTYFYWKLQLVTIVWYCIGIFSIIYFIYFPQQAFYKALKDKETKELHRVSKQMEVYYEMFMTEHDTEGFESFKNIHETSAIICKLHDWPFDFKALIYSGLAILPHVVLLIKTLLAKPM